VTVKVDHINVSVARSFDAMYTNKLVPPIGLFELVRVLALENCGLEGGYLKLIGKLRHLRYLGLKGTRIRELPEELGRLEFLQVLMLEETGIEELPTSLGQLKKLMCLRADKKTRVPDWIGKLTSLVELMMFPGAESKSFVKELGKLTDLRVLDTDIIVQDEEQARDLLESLSNLQKIEIIKMPKMFGYKLHEDTFVQHSLILCRNLRKLDICVFCFPRMPESIDPGVLPNLFSMSIVLMELCQRDMEIIGWFQKLCFLYLVVRRVLSSIISISSGDGLFQNLKYFHARFSLPMFVKQGAMPSLEHIELLISLRNVNIDNLDLVSGLGNLTSLQLCTVNISCTDCCAAEVEEVEDMVRHAVGSNPNRPTLKIVRTVEEKMVNDSGLLGPQRRRVCTCCPVFTITCLSVSLIPSKINNSTRATLWGRTSRQLELYQAMHLKVEKLGELPVPPINLEDAILVVLISTHNVIYE
jgi:disease resistance protein RPM1